MMDRSLGDDWCLALGTGLITFPHQLPTILAIYFLRCYVSSVSHVQATILIQVPNGILLCPKPNCSVIFHEILLAIRGFHTDFPESEGIIVLNFILEVLL